MAQITNLATFLILGIVLLLAFASLFVLRKMKRNHVTNTTEHKEIRQEIEIGDRKLEIRIAVLEKR